MKAILYISILLISTSLYSQQNKVVRIYAELGVYSNDTVDIDSVTNNSCVLLKTDVISLEQAKQNKLNSLIVKSTSEFDLKEYEVYKINVGSVKCLDGVTSGVSESNCLNTQTNRFFVKKNKVFIEAYLRKNGREIKEPLQFYIVIR